MNSILTVTAAATDLHLLTVAERRAAAGVEDGSKDAALAIISARVSASITAACNVRAGGAVPPTLKQETLSETFRLTSGASALFLARRPIVAVSAITEITTTLDADYDFEIDAAGGVIYRLSSDDRICWPCGKIAVSYSAGWATVPEDLKFAASKFVQAITQTGDRDPMLKAETIEGVSSSEFWVDPSKDSVVPAEVLDLLDRGGYVQKKMAW